MKGRRCMSVRYLIVKAVRVINWIGYRDSGITMGWDKSYRS